MGLQTGNIIRVGDTIKIGYRIAKKIGCLGVCKPDTKFTLDHIGRGYFVFIDNRYGEAWLFDYRTPEDKRFFNEETSISNGC